MRRTNGAEQLGKALLLREVASITVLERTMPRHDAECVHKTPASYSVAVSNGKFLGGSDVVKQVVDVPFSSKIDLENRIGDPLTVKVEAIAPAAGRKTEACQRDQD